MNIFDLMYPRFKFDKDKPIRIMELFSGIGFQRMGMDLAEIKHETVGISEIDKFAINSYNLIHGDTKNYGDISKIKGAEAPKDIDIMTYSYPCQDLSNAGNQAGMGKGTRSGLVYEVLRLLQELKVEDNLPKVLIMENVPDLLGVKFVKEFHKIQLEIEEMGYKNYTEILNARNYGIAQNRRRVFMVSILGDYNYNFPQPFELKTRLKDYLEDDVDESFYLSDKMLNFFVNNSKKNKEKGNGFRFKPKDLENAEVANALTTLAGNRMDDNFIKIPEDIVIGSAQKNSYKGDTNGYSPALTSAMGTGGGHVPMVGSNLRIRKLTPKETGRLMGMNDQQIDKQLSDTSNSQAYKQHGNGIVAQVIGLIIGQLVYDDELELRKTVLKNSHTWLKKENNNGK